MPDTYSSFVAGYTVAATILAIYIMTLVLRSRKIRAKVDELQRRSRP
jgi:hypothetical protein